MKKNLKWSIKLPKLLNKLDDKVDSAAEEVVRQTLDKKEELEERK